MVLAALGDVPDDDHEIADVLRDDSTTVACGGGEYDVVVHMLEPDVRDVDRIVAALSEGFREVRRQVLVDEEARRSHVRSGPAL